MAQNEVNKTQVTENTLNVFFKKEGKIPLPCGLKTALKGPKHTTHRENVTKAWTYQGRYFPLIFASPEPSLYKVQNNY